jgi:hypothetical protein
MEDCDRNLFFLVVRGCRNDAAPKLARPTPTAPPLEVGDSPPPPPSLNLLLLVGLVASAEVGRGLVVGEARGEVGEMEGPVRDTPAVAGRCFCSYKGAVAAPAPARIGVNRFARTNNPPFGVQLK